MVKEDRWGIFKKILVILQEKDDTLLWCRVNHYDLSMSVQQALIEGLGC